MPMSSTAMPVRPRASRSRSCSSCGRLTTRRPPSYRTRSSSSSTPCLDTSFTCDYESLVLRFDFKIQIESGSLKFNHLFSDRVGVVDVGRHDPVDPEYGRVARLVFQPQYYRHRPNERLQRSLSRFESNRTRNCMIFQLSLKAVCRQF